MHYYQFNIADYRKDTVHLSPIEHYIYRQLIDWYYLDERPIPKKTQTVMRRLCLGSEHEESLENVLTEFFDEQENGWFHHRIDEEIDAYHKKAKVNAANGKKGGRPKKQGLTVNEKPKKTQSVNFANPNESEKKPNHKPLTSNHKPDNKVDFVSYGFTEDQFEEITRIRKKNSKTAKEAKLTNRIIKELANQFEKARQAGHSLDDCLTEWELRGWTGFKADWMKSTGNKSNPALKTLDNIRDVELQDYWGAGNG